MQAQYSDASHHRTDRSFQDPGGGTDDVAFLVGSTDAMAIGPFPLEGRCAARAVLFRPDRERDALGRMIEETRDDQPSLAS